MNGKMIFILFMVLLTTGCGAFINLREAENQAGVSSALPAEPPPIATPTDNTTKNSATTSIQATGAGGGAGSQGTASSGSTSNLVITGTISKP